MTLRTPLAALLLLLAPACDTSTDGFEGDDPMLTDEAPGSPKADDPDALPEDEPDEPDDEPQDEPDGQPRDAEASPCTVGWWSIDCHANEASFIVSGQGRELLWQVPAGEPPAGGWPVVLAFHGTNDPADKMFYWNYYSAVDQAFGGYYQLKTIQGLLDAGFAVIAPKGRLLPGGIYWDTNIAPYASNWDTAPDALFVERIFEEAELGSFGPLDATRFYATGLSSGAYMSSRMAITYPDRFQAVALQSGSYATCLSSFPCVVTAADLPDDHPPTLLMAGYWDTIVPLYTTEEYEDALDANGTESTLEVVGYASHQWTASSPDWVLEWFQTH